MLLRVVPLMLVMLIASLGPQPAHSARHANDYRSSARFIFGEAGGAAPVPVLSGEQSSRSRARKRTATRRLAAANQSQTKSIEDILTDSILWGPDFATALSSVPAFLRAGETQVAVFPDRVIGRKKYPAPGQADAKLPTLSRQLSVTQRLSPRSLKMRNFMAVGRTELKPEVYLLPDDRTFRLAAVSPAARFLVPGVNLADVEGRLGKAERVTTELLDDGTERRPIVLTLHYYAGGAIILVESDINPRIGSVDRVFLDASKISAALF
ncbi:MAG TPA: hypothetical protein VKA60_15795 [Blastocatellia bacterium]|nr:hypothetical protein [Blastocatellia bacterium]